MNKQEVTKPMLVTLAKKFNASICDPSDPPLPTGKKKGETVEVMIKEITDAANDLLQPGDEKFFDDKDIEAMVALDIDFAKLTQGDVSSDDTQGDENAEATQEETKEKPTAKPKSGGRGKAAAAKSKPAVVDGKKGRRGPQANPQTALRRSFTEKLISQGKFTKAQVMEKVLAEFPSANKSTVQTDLSDGKNPKYNKFAKLVKEDPETKVLSF
jgi:hypothetical protein